MKKVFVLLSGGIDSSTTLAIADKEFPDAELEAVTVNYGQRHVREIEAAKAIVDHYNCKHHTLDLSGLMSGMLIEKGQDNEEIPNASYSELAPGISPTYVSFRNGLMLSALAARAQSWVMVNEHVAKQDPEWPKQSSDDPWILPSDYIASAELYCGVHADDGVNWAYPDCTLEFMGPLGAAIFVGTYYKVRLRTPLLFDAKAAVVAKGINLGVPYELTWSCYKGGEKHCGTCPTCRSRKEAFELNGAHDPTEYEA